MAELRHPNKDIQKAIKYAAGEGMATGKGLRARLGEAVLSGGRERRMYPIGQWHAEKPPSHSETHQGQGQQVPPLVVLAKNNAANWRRGKGWRASAPEGQPKIAQRFIAGWRKPATAARPVGTPETPSAAGLQASLRDTHAFQASVYPAINRWAIIKRPSGTRRSVVGRIRFIICGQGQKADMVSKWTTNSR